MTSVEGLRCPPAGQPAPGTEKDRGPANAAPLRLAAGPAVAEFRA